MNKYLLLYKLTRNDITDKHLLIKIPSMEIERPLYKTYKRIIEENLTVENKRRLFDIVRLEYAINSELNQSDPEEYFKIKKQIENKISSVNIEIYTFPNTRYPIHIKYTYLHYPEDMFCLVEKFKCKILESID
jgi:hypothetical protein